MTAWVMEQIKKDHAATLQGVTIEDCELMLAKASKITVIHDGKVVRFKKQ